MSTNNLYGAEPEWLDDRSGGTIESSQDGVFTVASMKQGTPFGIRLNAPPEAKTGYFVQIQLQKIDGGVSVGIVTPDELKGGWKTRGMFYNGNLTNGGAALSVGWGPRLKEAASIGLQVKQHESKLEMWIYNDERCIGKAFQLNNVPSGKIYHPCLLVDGTATIGLSIPLTLPTTEVEPQIGIDGAWELVDAFGEGGERIDLPNGSPIKMTLERQEESKIFVNVKVANSVRSNFQILEDGVDNLRVRGGRVMMSRMMPPPAFAAAEDYFARNLPEVTAIEVKGGSLGLQGTAQRSTWRRSEQSVALTSYSS